MFNLLRDFDKLEEAIKTYYYYLWEIEHGNYDFSNNRRN